MTNLVKKYHKLSPRTYAAAMLGDLEEIEQGLRSRDYLAQVSLDNGCAYMHANGLVANLPTPRKGTPQWIAAENEAINRKRMQRALNKMTIE